MDYFEDAKRLLYSYKLICDKKEAAKEAYERTRVDIYSFVGSPIYDTPICKTNKYTSITENAVINRQAFYDRYVDLINKKIDVMFDLSEMIRTMDSEYKNVLYSRFIEFKGINSNSLSKKVIKGIEDFIPVAIAYGKIEYRKISSGTLRELMYDCRLLGQAYKYSEIKLNQEIEALNTGCDFCLDENQRKAWKEMHQKSFANAELMNDVFNIRANESRQRVRKLIKLIDDDIASDAMRRYFIDGESIRDISDNKMSQLDLEELININISIIARELKKNVH